MSLWDDNPKEQEGAGNEQARPDVASESRTLEPRGAVADSALSGESGALLTGDPISYVGLHPGTAHPPPCNLPEDLRISWSWPHLLFFSLYAIISQIVIAIGVVGYYSVGRHLTQEQIRQMFESDPRLIVGTNVLWFALIFLFLYVTLSVLRDLPFWRSLGWKKINASALAGKGKPWMYFMSGSGLSLFVILAGSRVKNTEHVPIQEMFKSRSGAMLLMSMAVLIAPLVEETVFRGYLYPVFVRLVSAAAQFFGVAASRAIRAGVITSVLTTGALFGLMHAPQLGWTWGLVTLLILVGVIFTFARAWTGTVVASFFLHLGYNSMLALLMIVGTKGFTHMAPHP
jgi:membrane protease YdiL (CAAX protease family)